MGFKFRQIQLFIPWTCHLRSVSNASTSNLAVLRKRTGLAFNLCRKALELHKNDLDKAELWLKEETIRHGYQRAAQIKNRRAVQGLVSLFLDKSNSTAAMVELNCETDFVAKNEKFRELAAHVTYSLGELEPTKLTGYIQKTVNNYKLSEESLTHFDNDISRAITHFHENIKISRALLFRKEPHNNDVLLFGTTHAAGDIIPDLNGVQFGKYGAIVALKMLSEKETENYKLKVENIANSKSTAKTDPGRGDKQVKGSGETRQLTDEEIDWGSDEESDFEDEVDVADLSKSSVCRILCQHIIGYKPVNLKKSDQLLAKEAELREQGYKIPIETDCLLDQRIIINDSLTVSDFMGSHGFEVIDFVRYECGECFDE